MATTEYAFLIKAPGYSLPTHRAELSSPDFHARFVGVASMEEAVSAARQLAHEGVTIFELCGAFSDADAARIRAAAGIAADVGLVAYP